MRRLPLLTLVTLALLVPPTARGGSATHNPPDHNSMVELLSATPAGDATRLLYYTQPALGDPRPAGGCGFNYYVATLRPGLPAPQVERVAENYCRPGYTHGIATGADEGLILASDGIERWRAGKKVEGHAFVELAGSSELIRNAVQGGGFARVGPDANGVVALPASGNAGAEIAGYWYVVVGVDAAGRQRWTYKVGEPGLRMELLDVWAGARGDVLLHLNAMADDGSSMNVEHRAVLVDANGKAGPAITLSQDNQPDMAAMLRAGEMAQGDPSKMMAGTEDNYSELIRKIAARPRADGGFDVLIDRHSGNDQREGHWLFRIAPDGHLLSEHNLTESVEPHGLDRWADFYMAGETLVLVGNVLASQPAHGGRKVSQTAVNWIDPATGTVATRLLPLDDRYVEDLMNASDATYQFLKNLPGGEPRLLTALGSTPLAISAGRLDGGLALRFDEGTRDLVAWNEAWEDNQRRLAKEKARAERKAAREARSEAYDKDMAKAIGVSPEEYAAMSNKERKQAMVAQGDMQAMMAAAMKQAEAAQQSMAQNPEQYPGQNPTQGASDADVNAQVQAAMAQFQAAMAAAGQPVPGAAAPVATVAGQPPPENTLQVDAGKRGFVEFQSEDGSAVALYVIDRASGEELLNKDFADGFVYEYLDFNRFGRPLAQISVQLRGADGKTLKDMTPIGPR